MNVNTARSLLVVSPRKTSHRSEPWALGGEGRVVVPATFFGGVWRAMKAFLHQP